jgi:uncharacterized membrane protein
MTWILFASLAAIANAVIYFCCDILSQFYDDSIEIISMTFMLLGMMSLIVYYTRTKTITPDSKTLKVFGILVVAYFVFLCSVVKGIRLSPQPGYVHGIASFSTVLLFILYTCAFKQEINLNSAIGLILMMSGLYMLVKSSKTDSKIDLNTVFG